MKTILFLAAIFLYSCAPPQKLTTGTYTIKTIHGVTVSFREVTGQYFLMSDTIKVNDRITINIIKQHH